MPYAVRGFKVGNGGSLAQDLFAIHDTKEEADKAAVSWLRDGITDVSIWKQLETLKAELKINREKVR